MTEGVARKTECQKRHCEGDSQSNPLHRAVIYEKACQEEKISLLTKKT